jgi:hypothetical protein
MADHWYIVFPTGQSQGSTLYPKVPVASHIISTPVGSAEDKALSSGPGAAQLWGLLGSSGGTYQGLTNFAGPFDTQQQAMDFKPISGGEAFGAMLGAGLAGLAVGVTAQPGLSADVAPAAAAGSGVAGFFQANIWKRVAEAAIGLVLIAIGLNAFIKDTTGSSLSAKVPKVVPV